MGRGTFFRLREILMKRASVFVLIVMAVMGLHCTPQKKSSTPKVVRKKKRVLRLRDLNPANETMPDHKLVIYQVMTRLFGNKKTVNKIWGSREENGVGKFNDFTDKALTSLKDLGVTHLYLTGVLAHAVCADYRKFGIPLDDADVVKGRAGSPFAIKDYYDVNPDMAVNVRRRMAEFKDLIKRAHKQKLKVIIDLVPNHVARRYKSTVKPKGVEDLGAADDTSKAFAPNNNFYYIPGQALKVPKGNQTPGPGNSFPTKDGKFAENPAKATGNDRFTAYPNVNDWFETVKLNYGVDYQRGRRKHFKPIPSTWKKMLHIMLYWATTIGVDGMRCDMVEMVPLEFWAWAIPQVKKAKPGFVFIAEIYNPRIYHDYVLKGGFDYLYDKVGLYDTLKRLVKGSGNTGSMYIAWWTFRQTKQRKGITHCMLRFLENHDEQRFASPAFAGDPWAAQPAMTLSATMSSGPVMLYFGQEVGEPGAGREGFSGNDGRTTIFDYWGVPEHQKWMNGGKFDGGKLSADQKKLRGFYRTLFRLCRSSQAIRSGKFYDLQFVNERNRSAGYDQSKMYSYLRYTKGESLLVVCNFRKQKPVSAKVKITARAFKLMGLDTGGSYTLHDLLDKDSTAISFQAAAVTNWRDKQAGVQLTLPPMRAAVYAIKPVSKKTQE